MKGHSALRFHFHGGRAVCRRRRPRAVNPPPCRRRRNPKARCTPPPRRFTTGRSPPSPRATTRRPSATRRPGTRSIRGASSCSPKRKPSGWPVIAAAPSSLYQRFLTTAPPQVQVDATHIALARCAQELASRPPVVVLAPPAPPAPAPRPQPPRWWHDPWGLSLAAAGVAGLGIGLGWFIAADAARDDAPNAPTLAAYQARWSTAESRRDVAVIAASVGAAALIAAGIRFAIVRRNARRAEQPSTPLSLWVGPGAVRGRRFEAPTGGGRARAVLACAAGCLGTPSFVCHGDAQCGTDAFLRERRPLQRARPELPVAPPVPGRRRRPVECVRCAHLRRRSGGRARGGRCARVPAAARRARDLLGSQQRRAAGRRDAHAAVVRRARRRNRGRRRDRGGRATRLRRPRGRRRRLLGRRRHRPAGRRRAAPIASTQAPVPGVSGAVGVAAGAGFSCALLADGSAVCWGDDRNGELGDGAPAVGPRGPTKVAGLTDATALAANGQHACAVRADGSLVCWGSNATGQLGDGTLVNRAQPAAVVGLQQVSAVAAGLSHTCALSAAGLSCWGSNSQGQLGAETPTSTTPVTAPMPVPLVANPIAIAAGAQHTCAVRSTGAVLCWGQNGSGQLGEGSMSSLAEPVPVTGLDTGAAVSAGTTFTCARTSDGAVFCWGDDHDGELGTGRGVTESRPVALAGNAKALAAGGAHTCARHAQPHDLRRPGLRLLGVEPGRPAGRQRRRRPRAPGADRAAAGRRHHRRGRAAHVRRRRERGPLVLGTRQQRPDRSGTDGRHDGPRPGAAAGGTRRGAVGGDRGRAHLRRRGRRRRHAAGRLLRREQSRAAGGRHHDCARNRGGRRSRRCRARAAGRDRGRWRPLLRVRRRGPPLVLGARRPRTARHRRNGRSPVTGRGGAARRQHSKLGHGRRRPHLRPRSVRAGLVLGRERPRAARHRRGWRRRPGTSARRGAARCRRDGFGRRRAQLRLAERRTGLLLGRERERAARRRDDDRPRAYRPRSRGSRGRSRPGRPTPARSRRTATRRAGARTPAGNWATA